MLHFTSNLWFADNVTNKIWDSSNTLSWYESWLSVVVLKNRFNKLLSLYKNVSMKDMVSSCSLEEGCWRVRE